MPTHSPSSLSVRRACGQATCARLLRLCNVDWPAWWWSAKHHGSTLVRHSPFKSRGTTIIHKLGESPEPSGLGAARKAGPSLAWCCEGSTQGTGKVHRDIDITQLHPLHRAWKKLHSTPSKARVGQHVYDFFNHFSCRTKEGCGVAAR